MGGIQVRPEVPMVLADAPASETRVDGLSTDAAFETLSNRRRRYVICHLHGGAEERVRLRDLAEMIAAWENDVDPVAVTYKQRKRVYTSLYQSHLPQMDRLGIVEFDRNAGTVTTTSAVDDLGRYLDDVRAPTRWYDRATPIAAAGCLGLAVAAWFGVVPGSGVALLVSVLFLVASVIHLRYR